MTYSPLSHIHKQRFFPYSKAQYLKPKIVRLLGKISPCIRAWRRRRRRGRSTLERILHSGPKRIRQTRP